MTNTTTSQKHSTKQSEWVLNSTSKSFRKFGRIKEYAHPRRTLIDIDGGRKLLSETMYRIPRVARVVHIKPQWIRVDRTQHGWHVVIHWNRSLNNWSILALQAILGSDWRREAMNWDRLQAERKDRFSLKRWNILYEEKLK